MPSAPEARTPREVADKRVGLGIRTILDYKDAEVDAYLPQPIADGLRKVILDEINGLVEEVWLLAEAAGGGFVVNELALDRIAELLHSRMVDGGITA